MCAPVSSSRNSTAIDRRRTVSDCAISSSVSALCSSPERSSISRSQRGAPARPGAPAEQAGAGDRHGEIDGRERGFVGEDRPERGEQQQRRRRRPWQQRAEAGTGRIFGSRSLPHAFEVTPRRGRFHRFWLSRRVDRRMRAFLRAAGNAMDEFRSHARRRYGGGPWGAQRPCARWRRPTRCPISGGSARVAAVRRRLTFVAGLSLVVAVTALAGCGAPPRATASPRNRRPRSSRQQRRRRTARARCTSRARR